jgi:putative hemolysin
MGWVIAAETLVILVMIAIVGFLGASETSLTSVNRIRVRRMVEEEVRGAERLERLIGQTSHFLPVLLFLTLLFSFGVDSLATTLAVKYLGPVLGAGVSTLLATLLSALVIFVYGEVAPKTSASQRPERFALALATVVDPLTRVLYPVTKVFIWAAGPVVRLFGGRPDFVSPFVTEEEIKTIVTVGEEEGIIEEVEKEMIHSIFEFGDTVVREVMVPRTDMQTLEAGVTLAEAFEAIQAGGHSRIPMWDGSEDNVTGIVYAKDLLALACTDPSVPLPTTIPRKPYFVPESKRVAELLRDMRARKTHIAIAVDEYGGIAGLVTIEDLIEEIVGEIFDEYDIEEPLVEELPNGDLLVDARLPLEELEERFGLKLDIEDVDSVGGVIYALAGDIPSEGDTYELAGLKFRVQHVEGRRITKALISPVQGPPPGPRVGGEDDDEESL